MLKEIFEAIALGWCFGLGVLACILFLSFVDKLFNFIMKPKEAPKFWYLVCWNDSWMSLQAHNEVELLENIQPMLVVDGGKFAVYQIPYQDCRDVSEWKFILSSDFDIRFPVGECALERENNIEVKDNEEK